MKKHAQDIKRLLEVASFASKDAVNALIEHWNRDPIDDPEYAAFPIPPSKYGLFLPFSYVVRMRGRFDPNAFEYFPQSVEEAIIHSVLLHEYVHLQHFSATPAGIYASIKMNVLLRNCTILLGQSYGDGKRPVRIPMLRHVDDIPDKEFVRIFDESAKHGLTFFPAAGISGHESNLYPEDLSELSASYHQINFMSSRIGGNDVLGKVVQYMEERQMRAFAAKPQVSELLLWSMQCGLFHVIPIAVDAAMWGQYKDFEEPGAIVKRFFEHMDFCTQHYAGIEFLEAYEQSEEIWGALVGPDVVSGHSRRNDVFRFVAKYIGDWNRRQDWPPPAYFDTMTLGMASRRANLQHFLFPCVSFPGTRRIHDFPVTLYVDHPLSPASYTTESPGGHSVMSFAGWVHGEDVLQLLDWATVSQTCYQLCYCDSLMCPERAVMATCGSLPIPSVAAAEHNCNLERVLKRAFGLTADQLVFVK